MLFNSFDFAVFLILVFLGYWFVFHKNLKVQNFFILVVSCVFYGWWDWRFLILIFLSTIVDFSVGIGLDGIKNERKRKWLFGLSLTFNLGLLFYFKYCNFFIESFAELLQGLGFEANIWSLNVILPVGISFYTFQSLSYTIDVYRKSLKPTKSFIHFFAFVSFFPQLVAGPIERATHLLPQFERKRIFDFRLASNGMRQILWGLFKKIVIADNCAVHVNNIFENYQELPSSVLVIGAIYFAFQIYGDFSGYSDIAIGTSKLFGFDLMRNFSNPYFSRDIAEFWRRWHISLTTWFRDYVYFPLGGSQRGLGITIRNTIIVFVVSGFWHGANFTFIAWGAINALLFIPLLITNNNRKNLNGIAENSFLPSFKEFFQVILTFILVTFTWIFFRAESISDAFSYIYKLFSYSIFEVPREVGVTILFPLIFIMFFFEYMNRKNKHGLDFTPKLKSYYSWPIYYMLILIIFFFGAKEQDFIYFQF